MKITKCERLFTNINMLRFNSSVNTNRWSQSPQFNTTHLHKSSLTKLNISPISIGINEIWLFPTKIMSIANNKVIVSLLSHSKIEKIVINLNYNYQLMITNCTQTPQFNTTHLLNKSSCKFVISPISIGINEIWLLSVRIIRNEN